MDQPLTTSVPSETPSTRRPRRAPLVDPVLLPLQWARKGRSRDGALVRRIKRGLQSYIPDPSPAAEILVSRASWIALHLANADLAAIEKGGMSREEARNYASLSNALTETLQLVGLKATVTTTKVDDPPEVVAA